MSNIFIDVIRTDASRVDAQLLLGLRGESAYLYAVSQGYSGTETEFAQLMASYAEVAESAAASASSASQSATQAAQSSSASVRYANEARQMARDALTYANQARDAEANASASEQNASASAQSASASASAAATSEQEASDASEYARQKALDAVGAASNAAQSANTASSAATRAESARDTILAMDIVEDVTIEGTSIVDANNVADIPIMEKVTTYGSRAGLVPAFEGSITKSPSRHYLNAAGVWRELKNELMRWPTYVQLRFDGLSTTILAASDSYAGVMTASDKAKLDAMEAGAEVNVQSDWDQTDDAADDFIKNKPSVPTKVSDLENDVPYSTLEQMVSLLPTDTASGSIVSIPDGQAVVPAKSLKVALDPIQDLHGYDHPWVGGAGKNKLPNTATRTTTGGITFTIDEDGVITANGTATTDAYLHIADNVSLVSGQAYTLSGVVAASQTAYMYLEESVSSAWRARDYGDGVTFTAPTNSINAVIRIASGTTVNNIKFKPMIELGSTATSYEPYSNICPISGRDSVVTQRTGVNVWDEEWEVGGIDASNGNNNNYLTQRIRSKGYISVVPETQYRFVIGSNSSVPSRTVFWYDANKMFIGGGWVTPTNNIIIVPSNARYMRFTTNDNYGNTYNNDISINYPSTDTEYHAYDGETYTTNLGQTVYGGTLDVVSGELVVDRAIVDLGTEQSQGWYMASTSVSGKQRLAIPITDISATDFTSLKCNIMPTVSGTDTYIGIEGISNDASKRLLLYNSNLQTVADWEAWATANNLQACYPLANPQTIQLTPQEVQLLLGTNNVWSDGSVTLVYNADIQRWVEKKLGA